MHANLTRLAAQWRLENLEPIAETPRSSVYKCALPDGTSAALKIFTEAGRRSEGKSADALLAWDGNGAVRCLAHDPDGLLLEWVGGETLGDRVRNGSDRDAAVILAETAVKLQLKTRPPGAIDLDTYCSALHRFDTARVSKPQSHLIRAAQTHLNHLLQTAPAPAFMHGDLHHDNIALSDRGWLAFDPKSVWGDPHFEFANAFRNPIGLKAANFTPDRFHMMAGIFAGIAGLNEPRLLRWAAAKSALSIAWFGAIDTVPEPGWHILQQALNVAE